MRLNQTIHPEIALGLKGNADHKLFYDLGRKACFISKDNGRSVHCITSTGQKFTDTMIDHFCIINMFKSTGKLVYHVTADFLAEISKVNKAIPVEKLPDNFCAYISFARNVIKDEAEYIQGAYVYVGPSADTTFINKESPSVKTLWISYITNDEKITIGSLKTYLDGRKIEELIKDIPVKNYKKDRQGYKSFELTGSNKHREVIYQTLLNIVLYIHLPSCDLVRVNSAMNYPCSKRSDLKRNEHVKPYNECELPVTFVNWAWKRPFSELLVSGHLKWAACGPGMKDNHLIWVHSYPSKRRTGSATKGEGVTPSITL